MSYFHPVYSIGSILIEILFLCNSKVRIYHSFYKKYINSGLMLERQAYIKFAIDLDLLHQNYRDIYGAWRAMEELYEDGKIRAIGVSNFFPDRLLDLSLHNRVAPAMNQIEVNPFCQQIENHKLMVEFGVQTEAWSSLATERNHIFENKTLQAIAEKHSRTLAQVVLRWVIQRGMV